MTIRHRKDIPNQEKKQVRPVEEKTGEITEIAEEEEGFYFILIEFYFKR